MAGPNFFKPRSTYFMGPPMVPVPSPSPPAPLIVFPKSEDPRVKGAGNGSLDKRNVAPATAVPGIGPTRHLFSNRSLRGWKLPLSVIGQNAGFFLFARGGVPPATVVPPQRQFNGPRQDNSIPVVGTTAVVFGKPTSVAASPPVVAFTRSQDRTEPYRGSFLYDSGNPDSAFSQNFPRLILSRTEERRPHDGSVLFDINAPGIPIVIPEQLFSSQAETRAHIGQTVFGAHAQYCADVFFKPLLVQAWENRSHKGESSIIIGLDRPPDVFPFPPRTLFSVNNLHSVTIHKTGLTFTTKGGTVSGSTVPPACFLSAVPSTAYLTDLMRLLIRAPSPGFLTGPIGHTSGFFPTQDPPLVIDSFDVSYLIADTFNIGDNGTLIYNQVFFKGDVRRFQIVNFTIDGSAWAATGAVLVMVDPTGAVHSQAATQGSSTLFYYDTLTTDLNITGQWYSYWVLTDGVVTLTVRGQDFFVRDSL